ncbi:MAG: AmmeMemoRadiSam system protein A [Proteobacteria bacterium]|nr:AmmeMemoRadiSam system protein A [Pseudomonadota bacterium]MBU1386371.1 AmmeMemoRadiSam system protein A [Pseudomonadota bacterium]MBU1544482.1 AmmeMemoRadiSam system protein A [Pseudomonadota bacterium]MBU2429513.1 AmmeMemoRadiSam system protein A [Pseudomonadota bacterium]MBU2480339.1 AmmeMemoRadiSam system protein A [Pseudomonadota bacterium]
MMNTISKHDGQLLLKLAREHIATRFDKKNTRLAALEKHCTSPVMKENRGVFVTLHKNGTLRGCIGTIEPVKSLMDGVSENAIHAAFNDSRFKPLSHDELKDIHIEISILTPPEKLDYSGGNDLLSRLRPEIDGVIIEKGYHRATFLPQVWDQLKDGRDFLNHLCLKAGLASDEWKSGKLEICIYQVQSFEEDDPFSAQTQETYDH